MQLRKLALSNRSKVTCKMVATTDLGNGSDLTIYQTCRSRVTEVVGKENSTLAHASSNAEAVYFD